MFYLLGQTPYTTSPFDSLLSKPSTLLDDLWPLSTLESLLPSSQLSRNSSPLSLRLDEKENAYIVEAATPGVKREDLKIDIVGGRRVELSVAVRSNEGAADQDKRAIEHDKSKEGEKAQEQSEGGSQVWQQTISDCRILFIHEPQWRPAP